MSNAYLEKLNKINDPDLAVKHTIPDRTRIISIIKCIQVILFPDYYSYHNMYPEEAYIKARNDLKKEIESALCYENRCDEKADQYIDAFFNELIDTKRILLTDIQAIYNGDPAAKSKGEIILCYPGFYAITIYRIAHILYKMKIPHVCRIMTEFAHEKTGIDINPGAEIGQSFCIDHGTGIVIGETATIGHDVKIYQGVTIGAKFFELDENGYPVKSGKRHPDIGNNVVIYANATILGGTTRIGNNCVIGGSVWLTESVPDNETVTYKKCVRHSL